MMRGNTIGVAVYRDSYYLWRGMHYSQTDVGIWVSIFVSVQSDSIIYSHFCTVCSCSTLHDDYSINKNKATIYTYTEYKTASICTFCTYICTWYVHMYILPLPAGKIMCCVDILKYFQASTCLCITI